MNNFPVIRVSWATKGIYVSWPKNYHILKFVVQKWVRPIKNGVIVSMDITNHQILLNLQLQTVPFNYLQLQQKRDHVVDHPRKRKRKLRSKTTKI